MILTKEAISLIRDLCHYLPTEGQSTFRAVLDGTSLCLVPCEPLAFAESVYDDGNLILGVDQETALRLSGRTVIAKKLGSKVTLELLDRRRVARLACA